MQCVFLPLDATKYPAQCTFNLKPWPLNVMKLQLSKQELLPDCEASVCQHICVVSAGSWSHWAPPSRFHFQTVSFFLYSTPAQLPEFHTAFPFQNTRQVLTENLDSIFDPKWCFSLSMDQWRGLLIYHMHYSKAYSRLFSVICQISRFALIFSYTNEKKTMLVNVRWRCKSLQDSSGCEPFKLS